jgi:hypothetical protein
MKETFNQLKITGECDLFLSETERLKLKMIPVQSLDILPVGETQVPVPLINLSHFFTNPECCDPLILKLAPYLDGRQNSIRKISNLTSLPLEMVSKVIQHMVFRKFVTLIEVFQSSNCYTVTPELYKLYVNREMQRECVQYVHAPKNTFSPMEHTLTFYQVFRLYSCLKPNVPFSQFVEDHDMQSLPIDEQKFVIFGLVNGFVRTQKQF